MKRLYYFILLAGISLVTFNCQKEAHFNGSVTPGTSTINTDPVTATLQGNIVSETGQAAAGVTVKVGTKTVTTDARGYFRVINASLDKGASLVTAEKTGYFKAYRTFSATSAVNQVVIQLIKKTSAGTINSTGGGTVTLSNGSKIVLPANAVVKASGGAYSGSINVYAAYIDPTSANIDQTIPGSFLAIDKNNNRAILTSYGMLAVELESSAGEKLQIASGQTATLTTAIPSSLQSSAPTTISLWYVDEQTGLWKEEGTATKNGTAYTGTVKHFTYWNCDAPGPTINLSATFKSPDGLPLVYASISIRPAGSYGAAHGYTDSLGHINGPVPANTNLVLEVLSPCGTPMYSQNIGPFSSNTDIGTITVNTSPSIVTVQGRLLNCSGAPVSDGYAIINYNNTMRYASVQNANGDFATTFYTCGGMPLTCEILGVDATAQQQGGMINVSVTSPLTNAGNITACGTSSLQYINYNLDGINHSVSSLVAGDSFNGADYDSTNNNIQGAYIAGYHSNIADITFNFDNSGPGATYVVKYLSFAPYSYATLAPPYTITITHYAQVAGEFFEGDFSGQFTDQSGAAHTISCSFRVRKL